MSKLPKILITGATGLLGANLAVCYASSSDCTGWFATKSISILGTTTEQIDLTDQSAVKYALNNLNRTS